MSHPAVHEENGSGNLKPQPRPRRQFELGTYSTPSSAPSTPPPEKSAGLQAPESYMDGATTGTTTPAKTKSILNLTSSTLFGIYSPTGYNNEREEPSTPWGTGAQTPTLSRTGSMDVSRTDIPNTVLQKGPNGMHRRRRSTITQQNFRPKQAKGFKGYFLPLVGRTATLFAIGMLYGLLISHLHDKRDMAPVRVDGIDHSSWLYIAFWGVAGVALGQALPWIDCFWAAEDDENWEVVDDRDNKSNSNGRGTGGWNDVVRSIGAFVGIAFAIRKLPWQSTLQLSATLALANPAIWYLIDRSPPGFLLSAAVSLGGTALLLGINPALVPSPSPAEMVRTHAANDSFTMGNGDLVLGVFSQESVGVAAWIASVLFVSSVCFGNIGRRLAPQKG